MGQANLLANHSESAYLREIKPYNLVMEKV